MFKNFKYLSHNFTIKTNKKIKKCTTINYTTDFFENLISIQKSNILKFYKKKDIFLNQEFCVNTFKVNSVLNDRSLDILIANKITKSVSEKGIKSESNFIKLFETFYDNLKSNPNHPITKELLQTLNQNSFLFSTEEKRKLDKLLKEEKKSDKKNDDITDEEVIDDEIYEDEEDEDDGSSGKKRKSKKKEVDPNLRQEAPNTPEKNGKEFMLNFAKLKFKDDNINLYLDSGNKKVTIKSKHFQSKLKIIGLDDNRSEKILHAFNYVDKNKPNTLLIHKRPILFESSPLYAIDDTNNKINPDADGNYTSLLQREGIMKYCKEILAKNPKIKINSIERLVYEEVDSMKTISYLQSLILKSNYALNINPQIKIVLTDIPLFTEIEYLFDNVFKNFDPRDFFNFMKLSLLFEKYLWLIENCGDKCPACDGSIKFESAHLGLDVLIDDYLLSVNGINHIKIKNISDKIIKSIKFGDFKGNNIITFVEEKYFYLVIERLARDLNAICEGKDWDTIEKSFLEMNENFVNEFDFPIGDFEKFYKNANIDQKENIEEVKGTSNNNINKEKSEFLNKLAICLNIYQNKNLFENENENKNLLPELINLKDEFKSPLKDLYAIYNEKLNFVDEINLWSNRKYDYKCYPNEILINKFLNTGVNEKEKK